jgi:hypothetical protein
VTTGSGERPDAGDAGDGDDERCGWSVGDDQPCGERASTPLVVVGAGGTIELTLCEAHATSVRELPNVVRGPSGSLVMRWA